jgi:DNA topoisomerase VI subunit B
LYNDSYIAKITAKRYNIYLREEKEREKKRRHSDWINRIIAVIFWLLKLINGGLEKVNIKKKRIIERVLVE